MELRVLAAAYKTCSGSLVARLNRSGSHVDLNAAAADRLAAFARTFEREGMSPSLSSAFLNGSLRLVLKWRSQAVAERLIARFGPRVLGGPFEGMSYATRTTEGALAPRLLGTYESELHPALLAIAARGTERVIDVGCAEGYYAIGLARLMPGARIEAYDIDAAARSACAELAQRNNVADRISVRERFRLEDLGDRPSRTLVFMDVEGAEVELLSGEAPAILQRADVIVETHPGRVPEAADALRARFTDTHQVTTVYETPKTLPDAFFNPRTSTLDQFAATWEWRATPTPWLVMRPRG